MSGTTVTPCRTSRHTATRRFCLEVAKAFGQGKCRFYDAEEWARIQARYGSMRALQTMGKR